MSLLLAHWKHDLMCAPPATGLPTVREDPVSSTTQDGSSVWFDEDGLMAYEPNPLKVHPLSSLHVPP